LKNGIVVTSILCITAIFLLIVEAFGWQEIEYIILFLFLGGCAVWAALKYTIGSSAYGYHGLGDLFVFLFFGCVAVLGNQFLYTKTLEWLYVMPALGMGFLCVAVLNLNNLRDVDSDKNAGKNTLVVKMGFKRGKKYHAFLIMASFLAFVIYSAIEWNGTSYPIYLAVWGILFIHLIKVIGTKNPVNLDPELKKVALSTLLIAILFLISVMKIL
jgi:1,4-dihydroxy-2-naphthoate octaprenyltransferase